MRCRNVITAGAVVCLSVVSVANCFAGEVATVSYRDLCRLAGVRFDGTKIASPGEMSFKASSSAPNVKSSDLLLTLRSGDESHGVAVAADGSFVLPVNRKWFENDATVVTNQPKGSLRIQVDFKDVDSGVGVTAHLKHGRITFAALLELAAEGFTTAVAKEAAKRAGGDELKLDVAKPDGDLVLVVWVTDGDHAATATIANKSVDLPGKPAVQKLGPGIFQLPLTEALFKENPDLALSENPSWKCCLRQTARRAVDSK